MLSTIFGNNHSRYFLQMWQYETLSESASITASVTIGNRLPTFKYLKSPLGVLHHFVNFGCYFCLYEGKATYYTNIVSFILLFWRIRGRWLQVFVISFLQATNNGADILFFLTIRSLSDAFENACAGKFSISTQSCRSFLHGFVEASLIGKF